MLTGPDVGESEEAEKLQMKVVSLNNEVARLSHELKIRTDLCWSSEHSRVAKKVILHDNYTSESEREHSSRNS